MYLVITWTNERTNECSQMGTSPGTVWLEVQNHHICRRYGYPGTDSLGPVDCTGSCVLCCLQYVITFSAWWRLLSKRWRKDVREKTVSRLLNYQAHDGTFHVFTDPATLVGDGVNSTPVALTSPGFFSYKFFDWVDPGAKIRFRWWMDLWPLDGRGAL